MVYENFLLPSFMYILSATKEDRLFNYHANNQKTNEPGTSGDQQPDIFQRTLLSTLLAQQALLANNKLHSTAVLPSGIKPRDSDYSV